MASRTELGFPTFDRLKPLAPFLSVEMADAIFGVQLGVKRQRWCVLGEAMPVGKVGVFFLNMPTVGQQDIAQVAGARSSVNPTPETLAHQQGHVAAVVQVGMGQDDRIHFSCGQGQWVPVAQAQLFKSLEQTAIHQEPFAIMLDAVFGPGDGAGTA